MALARSESGLTIADSCASASPRKTPRKRCYTQVFSTPQCERYRRTARWDESSTSPLCGHTSARIPASFILPETPSRPDRTRQLTPDTLPDRPTVCRIDPASGTPAQHDRHLDESQALMRDLSDPARLSALSSRPRADMDDMLASPLFPDLLTLAKEDHARLVRNGDYREVEMGRIATAYVTQRHLARLDAALPPLDTRADDDRGSYDTQVTVPPTPPASEDLLTTREEGQVPPWPASGRRSSGSPERPPAGKQTSMEPSSPTPKARPRRSRRLVVSAIQV